MKSRWFFVAVAVLTVCTVVTPASALSIALVNPDFQADDTDPLGGYSLSLTGWTHDATAGTVDTASGTHAGYAQPVSDAHLRAAWIANWYDSTWVIQQVIDTYGDGNQYTFSIELGAPPAQYNDPVNVGGRLVLGYMDGATLVALATQDIQGPIGDFQLGSVSYTATSADVGKQIVVGFAKLQLPQYHLQANFDNAALGVTVVPEPGTMSLVALSLFGALVLRRK